MTALEVEAPGKLFVIGEYAVLHGGRALVAAIDAGISCRVEAASTWCVAAPDLGRRRDARRAVRRAAVRVARVRGLGRLRRISSRASPPLHGRAARRPASRRKLRARGKRGERRRDSGRGGGCRRGGSRSERDARSSCSAARSPFIAGISAGAAAAPTLLRASTAAGSTMRLRRVARASSPRRCPPAFGSRRRGAGWRAIRRERSRPSKRWASSPVCVRSSGASGRRSARRTGTAFSPRSMPTVRLSKSSRGDRPVRSASPSWSESPARAGSRPRARVPSVATRRSPSRSIPHVVPAVEKEWRTLEAEPLAVSIDTRGVHRENSHA